MKLTTTFQSLEARALIPSTPDSRVPASWLSANTGGAHFFRRESDRWELVGPEEYWRNTGAERSHWVQIPVSEMVFRPLGLDFYPDRIEWDRKYVEPNLFADTKFEVQNSKGFTGSFYTFRTGAASTYWWQHPPTAKLYGNGGITFYHDTNNLLTSAEFEKPATKSYLNKTDGKWLEMRRMRAKNEKALKVLKKLKSLAAEKLPSGWWPRPEQDADNYDTLLNALHPDSPGIPTGVMERFGEALLYQAKNCSNNYQCRYGEEYPSAADIDRAFESLRAGYRKTLYAKEAMYEDRIMDEVKYPNKFKV